MEYVYIALAAAASLFAAFGFYKAGKFKLTASRETMLGAGFGWIEKLPTGLVRVIALLELAGALGLVLGPIAFYGFALEIGIYLAIAAGLGLALTMAVAIWIHVSRGEFKYTWKMNLNLLGTSLAASGLWTLAFFAA